MGRSATLICGRVVRQKCYFIHGRVIGAGPTWLEANRERDAPGGVPTDGVPELRGPRGGAPRRRVRPRGRTRAKPHRKQQQPFKGIYHIALVLVAAGAKLDTKYPSIRRKFLVAVFPFPFGPLPVPHSCVTDA
jgi:hypothetical protein